MGAFGIFFVLLFVMAAGLFVIVSNQIVNETIDIVNPEITSGAVSTKYAMFFNLSVGLAKATVVFILIGVTGWGIVRALEHRDSGEY